MAIEIVYFILKLDKNDNTYRDFNFTVYEFIDSAKQAYDYYVENRPDEKFKLIEKVTHTSSEYQTLSSNE